MSASRAIRIRSVTVMLSSDDVPDKRTWEEAAAAVREILAARYPGVPAFVRPAGARRATRLSLDTDEWRVAESLVRAAARGNN